MKNSSSPWQLQVLARRARVPHYVLSLEKRRTNLWAPSGDLWVLSGIRDTGYVNLKNNIRFILPLNMHIVNNLNFRQLAFLAPWWKGQVSLPLSSM